MKSVFSFGKHVISRERFKYELRRLIRSKKTLMNMTVNYYFCYENHLPVL